MFVDVRWMGEVCGYGQTSPFVIDFGDPAGYLWEVAYNPNPIGQSVLP
jgi:hypothetical protein